MGDPKRKFFDSPLAHRMRNLAIKVSADLSPEFKANVTACYQAPSRAIAWRAASALVARAACENSVKRSPRHRSAARIRAANIHFIADF
jgi:hypothetical protein